MKRLRDWFNRFWYHPTIDAMQEQMLREIDARKPLHVQSVSAGGSFIFKAYNTSGWPRLVVQYYREMMQR